MPDLDARYEPGHVVEFDHHGSMVCIRRATGEFVEVPLWSYHHMIPQAPIRVGDPALVMYSPAEERVPGQSKLVGAIADRDGTALTKEAVTDLVRQELGRQRRRLEPISLGLAYACSSRSLIPTDREQLIVLRLMVLVSARTAWLEDLLEHLCSGAAPSVPVASGSVFRPAEFPSEKFAAQYRHMDELADRLVELRGTDLSDQWVAVSGGQVVWSDARLSWWRVLEGRYPDAFVGFVMSPKTLMGLKSG